MDELKDSIRIHLTAPSTPQKRNYLQTKCLEHFNEEHYINNLEKLLIDI
jgi:lactate dehydrogenase-like 2-hydroxyacid dehydrogenase